MRIMAPTHPNSTHCNDIVKVTNPHFHIHTEIMSTETTVKSINWRLVEVGRVVLVTKGKSAGKLAAIIEIIDHKRALIDGPEVPRQGVTLAHVTLTPHVVENLPRGAGHAALLKKWEASGVEKKWSESSWAKNLARRERRAQLTDFERFQVAVLRKKRAINVRKAVAKA